MNEHGLTREQRGELATLQAELEETKLHRSKTVWMCVWMCDQLQRELEQVRQERDEYQTKARWKHTHDDSLELELQKQLAECQKESDSRRDIMESQAYLLDDYVRQLAEANTALSGRKP